MRIFGLILLLASLGAQADGRPKWVISAPKADLRYKYYVGRAIQEVSEKEAWRVAKDQAQEMAVRENFGVETSIASSSYESAGNVSLDKRVTELFPQVRLLDFEQIDSFMESDNGRISVWILFRYPVSQIALEKERLKGLGDAPSAQFNEVGRPEIGFSTSLEVTSEPLGVPVFIDAERWGVTPLRLAGVLPSGVHRLKLSHANYQDVESDVVLMKGNTRRVHHKLQPAVGYLRVQVNPRGAEIRIDGISRGQTSVGPIQVIVGKPARVEAKLNGFETQIQMIEVQKDEVRRVQFTLNEVRRSGASTDVENQLASTASALDGPQPHQSAVYLGFLLGYSNASAPLSYGLPTAQLGLTLEKRFLRFFGIRVGASYDFAVEETKTSENSKHSAIEGSGTFVGLPVYLTAEKSGIYMMPEFGQIKHKRIIEEDDPYAYEHEFMAMSAQRRGIRLGWFNVDRSFDVWFAVHEYDWREYGKMSATSLGLTFTINDGGM